MKYLKSLITLIQTLLSTPEKPKDATQGLSFKDKEGNLIKGYAFSVPAFFGMGIRPICLEIIIKIKLRSYYLLMKQQSN